MRSVYFDRRLGADHTAIQSSDGRLWFAATNGAAWIDPARIHRNTLAPPVAIRSLTAGSKSYAPSPTLELPQRTASLQITYTAMSLSVPEQVRLPGCRFRRAISSARSPLATVASAHVAA